MSKLNWIDKARRHRGYDPYNTLDIRSQNDVIDAGELHAKSWRPIRSEADANWHLNRTKVRA